LAFATYSVQCHKCYVILLEAITYEAGAEEIGMSYKFIIVNLHSINTQKIRSNFLG